MLTRRSFLATGVAAPGARAAAACGWPGQGFGLAGPASGVLPTGTCSGAATASAWSPCWTPTGAPGPTSTSRPPRSPGATRTTRSCRWRRSAARRPTPRSCPSRACPPPPRLAISHRAGLPQPAPAGLRRPFTDDELARHGMHADDFAPSPWQQSHYGDRLYPIPLDTHPFTLYYNTDVAQKAALLAADGTLKPLDSPDALLAALQAAKGVTEIGRA